MNLKKTYLFLLMGLIVLGFALNYYLQTLQEEKAMQAQGVMGIKLSEDWKAWAQRTRKPDTYLKQIDKALGPDPDSQTILNSFFYDLDSPHDMPTRVYFDHGRYGFFLDNVLDVTFIGSIQTYTQGIRSITINFGIPPKNHTTHRQGYEHILKLLTTLKQAGWKRYIWPNEPRLVGQVTLGRSVHEDIEEKLFSGIDPNYTLTMEEWLKSNHIFEIAPGGGKLYWEFYSPEAVMSLNVWKDRPDSNLLLDPEQEASYLVTMEIQTWDNYLSSLDGNSRKPDVFAKDSADAAKERQVQEEKERARGLPLDTSYRDPLPPAHPPKADPTPPVVPPTEPEAMLRCRTGEVCPRSGLWEARLPDSHPFAAYFAKSGMNRAFREQGVPMLPVGFNAEKEAQVVWIWLYDERKG